MNPHEMITAQEQEILLRSARVAILHEVEGAEPLLPDDIVSPRLGEKRGVFVTLWQEGQLRGCVGFPYPVLPLGRAVPEAAVSAAVGDPRFPPVVPGETEGLLIEISVLTRPRPVTPEEVRIGVHGLIVKEGGRSGLLLPQVAIEHRWDVTTFLRQTCMKAGLSPEAWRQGAELQGFEAQIFSEIDKGENRPRR